MYYRTTVVNSKKIQILYNCWIMQHCFAWSNNPDHRQQKLGQYMQTIPMCRSGLWLGKIQNTICIFPNQRPDRHIGIVCIYWPNFCCLWSGLDIRGVWLYFCSTSQSTIFKSYMWRYIDVQADWRRSRWTYVQAPDAKDIS